MSKNPIEVTPLSVQQIIIIQFPFYLLHHHHHHHNHLFSYIHIYKLFLIDFNIKHVDINFIITSYLLTYLSTTTTLYIYLLILLYLVDYLLIKQVLFMSF